MPTTKKTWQSKKYEVVFAIEEVNRDKLFQHKTVYDEYLKLLKNQYVILIDKGEFEKSLGVKQVLEFLISEGEEYFLEQKQDAA